MFGCSSSSCCNVAGKPSQKALSIIANNVEVNEHDSDASIVIQDVSEFYGRD
jgi:hypothetical protein